MVPLLKVLEHLSYVIECVAADYMGEGKTELANLVDSLQSDESYRIPDSQEVASELTQALDMLKSNKGRGISTLCRVNRKLWSAVMGK